MILQNDEQLEDALVKLLAQTGSISAKHIQAKLKAINRIYSLQGIYKELNKLIVQGVIVKVKDSYSLSLAWVLNLTSLTEIMYKSHSSTEYISLLLPSHKQKFKWSFANLTKLDRFWIHTLIAISRHEKPCKLFQWIPHPWFALSPWKIHESVEAALRVSKTRTYTIIGGDTHLDRSITRSWAEDIYHTSHSKSAFDLLQASYITVCGDLILEVKLDSKTVDMIDQIFCSGEKLADLPYKLVASLFSNSIKATISLANDAKKAQKIRRKIADYFGVKSQWK